MGRGRPTSGQCDPDTVNVTVVANSEERTREEEGGAREACDHEEAASLISEEFKPDRRHGVQVGGGGR